MSETPTRITGYHFTGDNDTPLPPVGGWQVYAGSLGIIRGLGCSEHPYDALGLTIGYLLHRVELEGDLQPYGKPPYKWVGRRRRIIATINAAELLREFGRWCALRAIHLWVAPPVVRQYLETGDASLRVAAFIAARDAVIAAREATAQDAWAILSAAGTARAAIRAASEAAWHVTAGARADACNVSDAASSAVRAIEKAGLAVDDFTAGDREREAQRAKFLELVETAFKEQAK